jgi:hypothetical protein
METIPHELCDKIYWSSEERLQVEYSTCLNIRSSCRVIEVGGWNNNKGFAFITY